jgi:hypothetical protein
MLGHCSSSVASITRLRSPPEMPFMTNMGSVPPMIVSTHFSSLVSRITCGRTNPSIPAPSNVGP